MLVAYAVSAVLLVLAMLTSTRTKLTRHEGVYVRKPHRVSQATRLRKESMCHE